MPGILFFDTETTGKPRNYKAPMSDVDNWPRLVQIGVIQYEDNVERQWWEDVIIPVGFEIPAEATAVHGITTERAIAEGGNLSTCLGNFKHLLEQCDVVIGHNIDFDINVVGAEFIRMGMANPFMGKTIIDTMKSSTNLCAIPGPYGFKWPKLTELWFKLFGTELPQAHTALDDIRNTATCYFKLVELGVIKEVVQSAQENRT